MGGMNIVPQANNLQIDQPVDPLGEYARAQALRYQAQQMAIQQQQARQSAAMAPMQQQAAQQAIESGAMDLARKKIETESLNIMRQIQPNHVKRDEEGKPIGFDWNGYATEALQSGADPEMVAKAQKQAADLSEALAKANEQTRKDEEQRHGKLHEIIQGVLNSPDPMTSYKMAIPKAAKLGIDVGQLPPTFPDVDALKQNLLTIDGSLGIYGQALADAKIQAETEKARMEASMGGTSDASRFMASYLKANNLPDTPKNRLEAQREYIKETKVNPFIIRDEAKTKLLEPEIEAAAQAITNPKNLTALKDIASMRGDQRLRIFARAREIDPTFDPGLVQRRVDFVKSYEDPKGRAATNRQAINNIMQHASDLSDLNDQYRRANVKVINTPLNEIARQFGDDTFTRFATTNAVLKDELALYFAGGYAPQQSQMGAWEKIQSDQAPPSAIEAFAKEVIHLGLRRATTFNSQFHKVMGYDDPNMIVPEAKDAAEKLGLAGEVSKFGSGGGYGQGADTGFGEGKRAGASTSGKAVSLAAAKQLPRNKGKSDAEIKADIEAHGHRVIE